MTVLDYIHGKYIDSGWPFVSFQEIANKFGNETTKNELNKMFLDGIVRKRDGCNGKLVQLIVAKDGEIIEI